MTQHQVDKARGTLRDLMGKQIVPHPTADGKARYLSAEVSGDYTGLLKLVGARNPLQNKSGGGEPSFNLVSPTIRVPLRSCKTLKTS